MADQPDKKPVQQDSELVSQHKRLAQGAPVDTGAGKGKPTKW